MDPRLLAHYNTELQHLRETGAEFARQFPRIAARLSMDGIEVNDPYVERLIEGAAFLAARVQLKLDAEFPRFTQRLLEIVYPNYLTPTPAMLVASFRPQLDDSNLVRGSTVRRGTALHAEQNRGDVTRCEFRLAHDIELWPIEVVQAEYFAFAPDLPLSALPVPRIRGGVRLRLRTPTGVKFADVSVDRLRFFLGGNEEVAYKLYELCFGACVGALAGPATRPMPWHSYIVKDRVLPVGFGDEESLLPVSARTFQGHRLLQEYFAFPHRFLFFELGGLSAAVRRHDGNELDVALLFDRNEPSLEGRVDASNFLLYCAPAVNLFPRGAERIHVTDADHELHVVPDRVRPLDLEVFEVTGVKGYGVGAESERTFYPLYAAFHEEALGQQAYYTVRREPRLLSASAERVGFRSSYIGTEVFISIVDPKEAPYSKGLRQLEVSTLCTNRDLPLQMPLGVPDRSDFVLDEAASVESVRCVKGPSRPSSPLATGAVAWRLVSLLSLNYLSLLDVNGREGAAALRELLLLFSGAEPAAGRQIEGVRSVTVERLVRRLPLQGPIAFGRGLGIDLEVEDMAFEGASAFLFGAVLERFWARHVSLNSFTETRLRSGRRGQIMVWKPRCGARPIV